MTPLPKLMVAPNGARKTKADHPALPITLDEIIAEAISCYEAGADGLHLHLRDENGQHVLDAELYKEALAELRQAVPGMVLQITTEAVGRYTPAQQRAIVEQVKPEAVSISLAEMLAGTETSIAVAFYKHCAQAGIAVQHILYGERDLKLISGLLAEGHLEQEELQLLFVLGRYQQDQQSTPKDLDIFVEWLHLNCIEPDWAACAFGLRETECLSAAHKKGGKVRVGFENSFWNADGSVASSNAERVVELKPMAAGLPVKKVS